MESDVKRMVTNAKAYNEKGSEIWTDAEKIRKHTVEFMRANNPAYRDPSYVPFPTPLPEDTQSQRGSLQTDGRISAANGSAVSQGDPASGDVHVSPRPSGTPGVPDLHEQDVGFAGKTFQEAQEMILGKVMNLQNDKSVFFPLPLVQLLADLFSILSGDRIAEPFMSLPPKKLKDYYALIKRPVSLRSIWKKVRGVHGRNGTSGYSDFAGWDALEEEMSLIWRNAREYNEDDSAICRLAGEIEVCSIDGCSPSLALN